MLYPAVRGCIVHDMDYGELDDRTVPGDPLAGITAELAECGGPKTYACQAIIFMPHDGHCGEVFVLIPEELRAEVAELMAAAKLAEALRNAFKDAPNN